MASHPIFTKYTRGYLHEVTGFSKGYLCRLATGKAPLTPSFIDRTCFRLNKSAEELFLLDCAQPGQCLEPGDCSEDSIGQWLEERCREERLSLKQAATKTGLSQSAVFDIIDGVQPSEQAIKKLAQAFGGDGNTTLKDHLLALAGYNTEHPEEAISEIMARIRDKLRQFNEPELKIMKQFAEFITAIPPSEPS